MSVSPDIIARVRERYAAGDSVQRIMSDTRMSSGTLYHWIDGGPADENGPRLPPLPRRNSKGTRRAARKPGTRLSLVKRLWRTAEWQVRDIEDRLRQNPQQSDERERDARMLAVIVKTVRELSTLRDADEDNPAGHDAADIDDFRRDLARKIDAIIASGGGRADNGDEPA